MHELAITQSIVEAIVAKLGDTPVLGVRLEIGRLAGVVPDSIRFCFDLVTEGTPMAGAWLEISEPPGRAACRDCTEVSDVDSLIVLCPKCGSADVEVLSGRELRIESVEVNRSCVPPADAPPTPR
jgi:hydrogenase nickel incorporation protein HypA/HybF